MIASEQKPGSSETKRFGTYEQHYQRIGNEVCDWNFAEAHASAFAWRPIHWPNC